MVHTADSSLKSLAIQVGASLLANLGMVNCGMVIGFPSAVVPPLLGSGPGLHASVEEASLVAGLCFASAPVGCLVAGPLVDCLGRRLGLLLLNITFAAGWLLLAFFPYSLHALYAGRLLTGLGIGLASCAAVTYTTEIVTSRLRTNLVTLTPVMMAIGNFLSYLGALIFQDSWTELSFFAVGLTAFCVVMTPQIPESPLWLLNKGRSEEALHALQRLRGAFNPDLIKIELESFTKRIAKDQRSTSSWKDTFTNMSQPEAYKPLLIMNMFFVFHHLSGVSTVIAFAVDFTQAAGVKAEAYYVALAVGVVRMFSASLNSWACSRYGRRPPAVLSGIVMATSLLALAASPLYHPSPWLSGGLVLVFVLSSSVGFSTLPWSMLGEVFPTNVRGVASGLSGCLIYLGSFTSAWLYTSQVRALGTVPVFLFFAINGFIATLFLYFFLPETHGKTLIEIEESFRETKKSKRKTPLEESTSNHL